MKVIKCGKPTCNREDLKQGEVYTLIDSESTYFVTNAGDIVNLETGMVTLSENLRRDGWVHEPNVEIHIK